uniref:Uncharacterized protein n=1 Tax=Anguilla anguilla TaxID=7936 RepID=A0A0E9S9J6_ANGAN
MNAHQSFDAICSHLTLLHFTTAWVEVKRAPFYIPRIGASSQLY